MSASPSRGRIWRRVRRVWATFGVTATVIFAGWSIIAYRASPEARAALRSDSTVVVTRAGDLWRFDPVSSPASVGLLFVAGSLVDPVAYAPLLHAAAAAGYASVLVPLPRRGAFGGADDPSIAGRIRAVMQLPEGPRRWVLAGHSRGAVVATNLASSHPNGLSGLILIGTSHPRDVSLAGLRVPVTKIMGTRDGLASVGEVEANQHLLPPNTHWVRIEGGNHSQFGWYGFQPGDRRATIPAAEQRAIMVRSVLEVLGEREISPPSESAPPR